MLGWKFYAGRSVKADALPAMQACVTLESNNLAPRRSVTGNSAIVQHNSATCGWFSWMFRLAECRAALKTSRLKPGVYLSPFVRNSCKVY